MQKTHCRFCHVILTIETKHPNARFYCPFCFGVQRLGDKTYWRPKQVTQPNVVDPNDSFSDLSLEDFADENIDDLSLDDSDAN